MIAYAATLLTFAALDVIWLAVMGPRLYKPRLGDLLGETLRLGPTIAFYLLFAAGATLLVVLPALRGGPQVLATAPILGLVAYGAYDLTNWATLKRWSALITVADMIWGAVATTLACWSGVAVALAFAG